MTRITLACLGLAVVSGTITLLPETLSLGAPLAWHPALRLVCLAGLAGFATSFIIGLDRRSLLRE